MPQTVLQMAAMRALALVLAQSIRAGVIGLATWLLTAILVALTWSTEARLSWPTEVNVVLVEYQGQLLKTCQLLHE